MFSIRAHLCKVLASIFCTSIIIHKLLFLVIKTHVIEFIPNQFITAGYVSCLLGDIYPSLLSWNTRTNIFRTHLFASIIINSHCRLDAHTSSRRIRFSRVSGFPDMSELALQWYSDIPEQRQRLLTVVTKQGQRLQCTVCYRYFSQAHPVSINQK